MAFWSLWGLRCLCELLLIGVCLHNMSTSFLKAVRLLGLSSFSDFLYTQDSLSQLYKGEGFIKFFLYMCVPSRNKTSHMHVCKIRYGQYICIVELLDSYGRLYSFIIDLFQNAETWNELSSFFIIREIRLRSAKKLLPPYLMKFYKLTDQMMDGLLYINFFLFKGTFPAYILILIFSLFLKIVI